MHIFYINGTELTVHCSNRTLEIKLLTWQTLNPTRNAVLWAHYVRDYVARDSDRLRGKVGVQLIR